MKRRDACLLLAGTPAAIAADFASNWSPSVDRIWLGPEYWANRLQDWRMRNGRIECAVSGGDRNVYLLTHELSDRAEPFETRVRLGRLDEMAASEPGYAGLRIGMRGPFNDYRDTAIYGIGLDAGITADGRLFMGDPDHVNPLTATVNDVQLVLRGEPADGAYRLTLTALDDAGVKISELTRNDVPAAWLTGGLALVCSAGPIRRTPDPSQNVMTMGGVNRKHRETGGATRFWFREWKISGRKVDVHAERAWGPILFAMHTLSRNVLKLTAQMAPVNPDDGDVQLQIRTKTASAWKTVGAARIDPLSRTATFRIPKWDDTRDTAYRVRYAAGGGQTYEGTIRRDPRGKSKIVAGGLSCINDLGFPHPEILRNLQHFKPDLLLWVGDQIYEHTASYGIERLPLERAALDYLRKWYLFGWAFREILRDTPSVCMPDDHDVFHGNVWGAGGRHAEGTGQAGQDSGGYLEPAAWVNMVQRTQTSHLPDPFDPAPVEQNIGVYYTDLRYGGVSFAILEDRKWKSAPKMMIPKAKIVNGWAQNPEYNAATEGDVAGAELLGPRQIAFLKHWAADWSGGVWMKAAVSQTLFANVATLPPPANTDAVTPRLPILPPGGYAEGEVKVADHDSNGWPQTPRNEALRVIRRALAVHICGDQHLGSTTQYGVEDWSDGPWAICVPAVSNLFPRRWYPPERGNNQREGAPRNTGEYLDGFGNRVTVHTVFNPAGVNAEPKIVNQRSPGYGIIELNRATQEVTFAVWPRWLDASAADARPCEGWPIPVRQVDNGLPRSNWRLDAVTAQPGALIEVKDQTSGEHIYTYRMVEPAFSPPVPSRGTYIVTVRNAAGDAINIRRDQEARGG